MKKLSLLAIFSLLFLFVYGQNKNDSTSTTPNIIEEKLIKVEPDSSNQVVFRGSLYSDLVGVSDDQPNGLIQTEAFFSFPLIRREIVTKWGVAIAPFRNIVAPDFILAKVEDNQRFLDVRYSVDPLDSSLVRSTHTLDLIQFANLSSSVKLNVLTFKKATPDMSSVSGLNLYVDALAGHFRTGLRDTLRTTPEFNVNSYGLGYSVKLEFKPPTKRLELDLAYAHFWPQLFSNNYSQGNTLQVRDADLVDQQVIDVKSQYPVDRLQARIKIKPKKDRQIRIKENMNGEVTRTDEDVESDKATYFLRASYFGNFFEKNRINRNEFFQLQFGVSFSLDNFLKPSKDRSN